MVEISRIPRGDWTRIMINVYNWRILVELYIQLVAIRNSYVLKLLKVILLMLQGTTSFCPTCYCLVLAA